MKPVQILFLNLSFLFLFFEPSGGQPVFQWAAQSGGKNSEIGKTIQFDHDGNIVVAGDFGGTTHFGDFTFTTYGGGDIFLAKYSPEGHVLWAQQAGGPDYEVWEGTDPGEWVEGVVIDPRNDIILYGRLQGKARFGPFTVSSDDEEWPDVFIAKYAPDGTIKWVQTYGDYEYEEPYGLAVDAAGNIYFTGIFYLDTRFGPFELDPVSSPDIFLVKADPDGKVIWAKMISGAGDDYPADLLIDPAGDLVLCGRFIRDITLGPTKLTTLGLYDIFLAKFDAVGNPIWACSAGGTGMDLGKAVDCDKSGNLFLTGTFERTANFSTTAITSRGGADVFVAQFSSRGVLKWVQSGGSSATETSQDIVVDSDGNCRITGAYQGTAKFGELPLTSLSNTDIFLVQYSRTGECRQATSLGGANTDEGYALALQTSRVGCLTGYYREELRLGDLTLKSDDPNRHYFVTRFYDKSPDAFVKIKSPNKGEVWVGGNHFPVYWESDQYEGEVKIELSTNGGAKWRVLSICENDGQRHVHPGLGDISTHCLIRISLVGAATVQDQSDGEFTIIGPTDAKHYFANQIPAGMALPVIDGTLNDVVWSFANPAESLRVGDQVFDYLKPWVDLADICVTWQALWSAVTNRMYLAVNVQDDSAGALDHPLDRIYNDESIELFTDGDGHGGFYTGAYDSAQHWLIRKDNLKKLANFHGEDTGPAILSATQSGAKGNWTLELEMTLFNTYPGVVKSLAAGDSLGWDIWYNDSDNHDLVGGKYMREHQVGWGYVGPAWDNAFTFQKMYLAPEPLVTFTYDFPNPGWYLISLPVAPLNGQLMQLFPTAQAAFAWNSREYEIVETLHPRQGYWLLIREAGSVTICGQPLFQYTTGYESGWVLVGSPFSEMPFIDPVDTPDNSVIAAFSWDPLGKKYDAVFPDGASLLQPGMGYWIAVMQPCTVFYGPAGAGNSAVKPAQPGQIAGGEYPPPPPFILEVASTELLPRENRMLNNYPNPFNPVTRIQFELQRTGETRLYVHNTLGQRVRTLVEGVIPAGVHQVEWNARNDADQPVPSGLYFYTIETSDWRETRKMLLMK